MLAVMKVGISGWFHPGGEKCRGDESGGENDEARMVHGYLKMLSMTWQRWGKFPVASGDVGC